MAKVLVTKDLRDEGLGIEESQSYKIAVTSAAPSLHLAESEQSNAGLYADGTFGFTPSSDGTYMIVTGMGQYRSPEIEIPAEFGGLPVREIASSAFEEKNNEQFITSVVLPNTITRIGDRAFANCWKLASVTIPNSVRSIGNYAFTGSGYLTNVTFEDSAIRAVYFDNSTTKFDPLICTYWGSNGQATLSPTFSVGDIHCFEIPEEASGLYFSDRLSLVGRTQDITTGITNNASWFCGGDFTTVNGTIQYKIGDLGYVPDYNNNETKSGLRLGNYVFSKCEVLTEITLPRRLEKMGTYVFNECEYLENVNFVVTARITEIPKGTFSITDLSNITLPHNIVRICEEAFYDCHGTAHITIPNQVKYIGPRAFADGSITGISFEHGSKLEIIDTEAFCASINLGEIDIPSSVINIRSYAFRDCTPDIVITFSDPYTWFTTQNTSFLTDYTGGVLMHPDFLSGKDTGIYPNQTVGQMLVNDGGYGADDWYKLKRMPKPTTSISGHTLTAIDPLGVAEEFHIYVNGIDRVTIRPDK